MIGGIWEYDVILVVLVSPSARVTRLIINHHGWNLIKQKNTLIPPMF